MSPQDIAACRQRRLLALAREWWPKAHSEFYAGFACLHPEESGRIKWRKGFQMMIFYADDGQTLVGTVSGALHAKIAEILQWTP